MKIRAFSWFSLAMMIVLAPAARGAEPGDGARDIAVKVTTEGAAMFDAENARGLAATYTDDARFDFIAKDKDTGALKVETKVGRAEIQAFHEDLFKDDAHFHARNTVEYARFAGPDLLVIAGVFEPDSEAADPIKLPFTQIRAKRDGAWRIVSLQVILAERE